MDLLLMEANRIGTRIIREMWNDYAEIEEQRKAEELRHQEAMAKIEQERIEIEAQGKRNIEHKTLRNEYITQNELSGVVKKRYSKAVLTKLHIDKRIHDSIQRSGYVFRKSSNNTYNHFFLTEKNFSEQLQQAKAENKAQWA